MGARTIAGLVALLVLTACGHAVTGLSGPTVAPAVPTNTATTTAVVPVGAPDYVNEIADEMVWAQLAARPEFHTAARTEVVKVIIDLENESQIYFCQSTRWNLHYAFVRRFIDPRADHGDFNQQQYRSESRRFILGSVVRYLDQDLYTFELAAGDTLDAERLHTAFGVIAAHFHGGDVMRFRPRSERHEGLVAELGERLPSIGVDEVHRGVIFQPVVLGVGYGYLRIVRGPLDITAVQPNDLLVTELVPDELPPIGGIITSQLQAPLAHVAVLSQNRGTPDMAYRGAIDEARFRDLEGQLVKLTVTPQDFMLERADLAEAEARWADRRPRSVFTPPVDADEARLRPLCEVDAADAATVGAKAAQLGEVCGLGDPIVTPGGFTVPFHYYLAHVAPLSRGIRQMLEDGDFQTAASAREARLEELRHIIERRRVSRPLLREIRRRLRASSATRFIFRSSTNAEDLVGFNGAGLYRSIVVARDASEAELATTLRQVWSSVWLQRAYEEREWYRIDHAAVAMGVLIQPFVGDVVGSGVAITANPFDEGRPGVFINVQTRAGSVTSSTGEIPEQAVVYTWTETPEVEILARSSRTEGRPILTTEEFQRLTGLLQLIHERMTPSFGDRANAVDVEFLLTADRSRFVIVQARPYRVSYMPGQRWRTY